MNVFIIKRFVLLLFCIQLSNISSAQLTTDTLYYNDTEIRICTFLIVSDTVAKAYIENKFDKRNDQIKEYIEKIYPTVSSFNYTDLKDLIPFNVYSDSPSMDYVVQNFYWMGAINYYSIELQKTQVNYLDYFIVAKAISQYETYSNSKSYNKSAIALLDSCISLKGQFKEANVLRTKLIQENRKINRPLSQCVPNPFSSNNNIDYFIPSKSKSAKFVFTDIKGNQIKTIAINHTGSGSVDVDTKGLRTGVYSYTLIIDDVAKYTKKMIVE